MIRRLIWVGWAGGHGREERVFGVGGHEGSFVLIVILVLFVIIILLILFVIIILLILFVRIHDGVVIFFIVCFAAGERVILIIVGGERDGLLFFIILVVMFTFVSGGVAGGGLVVIVRGAGVLRDDLLEMIVVVHAVCPLRVRSYFDLFSMPEIIAR